MTEPNVLNLLLGNIGARINFTEPDEEPNWLYQHRLLGQTR